MYINNTHYPLSAYLNRNVAATSCLSLLSLLRQLGHQPVKLIS